MRADCDRQIDGCPCCDVNCAVNIGMYLESTFLTKKDGLCLSIGL